MNKKERAKRFTFGFSLGPLIDLHHSYNFPFSCINTSKTHIQNESHFISFTKNTSLHFCHHLHPSDNPIKAQLMTSTSMRQSSRTVS
jgi:hypothetical protein